MKIEKRKNGVFIDGKLTEFKKIPTAKEVREFLSGKPKQKTVKKTNAKQSKA